MNHILKYLENISLALIYHYQLPLQNHIDSAYDTMLTKAVVDKIERGDDGCEAAKPLADSYRSQPAIVNLCNNVFKETFDGILTADKVCLNPVKEQKEEKPLRWWSINRDDTTIPMEVYHMIAEDGVRPEDIAILSRNNWAEAFSPIL